MSAGALKKICQVFQNISAWIFTSEHELMKMAPRDVRRGKLKPSNGELK